MSIDHSGEDRALAAPSAAGLFLVFAKVGLSSFGGGLSAWIMRELVQTRRWLGEEEFLTGLALAQAFPGINVVNIAIWVGFRLRGSLGALASATGIIVPPALVVIAVSVLFTTVSQYPLTHVVLDGVAAAAIGLSLSMGVFAGRRAARGVVPAVIMASSFAGVGLLHWPIPLVVAALAPVSIAYAYRSLPAPPRAAPP